jgi:chromosome segregation ATPase
MQASFLPQTLGEWLTVAVGIVGVLASSWALAVRTIRGPLQSEIAGHREHLNDRLQHQGERIGRVEASSDRTAAKVESNDRQLETLHLQVTAMYEQHGRFEAKFDELRKVLEERKDQRYRDHQEVLQRLTAIETEVRVGDTLKEALIALARREV